MIEQDYTTVDEFQIGDRVELVGEDWDDIDGPTLGEIVTISELDLDNGQVWFDAEGDRYFIDDEYFRGLLVERPDEDEVYEGEPNDEEDEEETERFYVYTERFFVYDELNEEVIAFQRMTIEGLEDVISTYIEDNSEGVDLDDILVLVPAKGITLESKRVVVKVDHDEDEY